MSTSSLQHKTIRPGSLAGYDYYYSNRRQPSASPRPSRGRSLNLGRYGKALVVPLILAAIIGVPLLRSDPASLPSSATASLTNTGDTTGNTKPAPAASAALPVSDNHCTGNTLDKFIKISVSQRHLWACEAGKQVFDAPVITGLVGHPETETPPGTYRIYAKQQDTTLKGQDSRGAWSYPVYYWMPFLDNQYGTYGFHDATWRPEADFGNIDPHSDKASHGCIELSKTHQAWLYNWASVHTTLTVEN